MRGANAYPHQESLTQWHELKRANNAKAVLWGVIMAVVGGVLGWVFFQAIGAFLASLILGINVFVYLRRVNSRQYYAIAHSRDAEGEHRCIFCGNRGIYKKGEYKTNNTHSNCSKCGEPLFSA